MNGKLLYHVQERASRLGLQMDSWADDECVLFWHVDPADGKKKKVADMPMEQANRWLDELTGPRDSCPTCRSERSRSTIRTSRIFGQSNVMTGWLSSTSVSSRLPWRRCARPAQG